MCADPDLFASEAAEAAWIAEEEAEAKAALAATDECPRCGNYAVLSDARERGVNFTAPLCEPCREEEIRELFDDRDRED